MEKIEARERNTRGRRARFGKRVVPKSITFNPQTLERVTDLAASESDGNLSECVNALVEEALASRDASDAFDAMAKLLGVEITEAGVQRATEWLLETRRRIEARRAAPSEA